MAVWTCFRQECHEHIRELSQQAGDRVKMEGKDNDLIQRSATPIFLVLRFNRLIKLQYGIIRILFLCRSVSSPSSRFPTLSDLLKFKFESNCGT